MTMDHRHMTTRRPHSTDVTDLEEGDTLQHTCGATHLPDGMHTELWATNVWRGEGGEGRRGGDEV